MGLEFWIKRYITVFAIAATLLTIIKVVFKSEPFMDALMYGLLWGTIAAAAFTASRVYQSRKGQECALCDDIPKNDKVKEREQ
ncbi:MAG: hypothetical protein GY928_24525 [Colwellia sp.]|nr:hypothetical protein [Colwellia sp.]